MRPTCRRRARSTRLYAARRTTQRAGRCRRRARTGFRVWAPTARSAALCLYDNGTRRSHGPCAAAARCQRPASGPPPCLADLSGKYYTYLVDVFVPGTGIVRNRVTDPYSIGLTTDSKRSYIADLDAPALKPAGWDAAPRPAPLAAQTDMSIYELHVRDFSIGDGRCRRRIAASTSPSPTPSRNGMRHLRALGEAGLTDVHLLPVFDIATIPEARLHDAHRSRSRAGQRCATSRGDGAGRARLLQLGLRPVSLQRARRQLRHRRGRCRRAHPRVPRDGDGAARRRPARGHGRGLQPHHRVGTARALGARPHRARLLPAPGCERQSRTLDLLRQHRHRTSDDGEADDRFGRAVGEALPHRFVPLRPDGPPAARSDGGRAAARGCRGGTPHQPDRRRLELRRDRRRQALRAGLAALAQRFGHRHLQRPRARRAARRRLLRQRRRRHHGAGLPQRPVLRAQCLARRQAHAQPTCCALPISRASASPARCAITGCTTADGSEKALSRDRLQGSARRLRGAARRSRQLRREPRQPDPVRHQRR